MFTLQRCRSHEARSNPAAWEPMQTGEEAEIMAAYWSYLTPRSASGDQFRIVDAAGNEQAITSPTTCGPMR